MSDLILVVLATAISVIVVGPIAYICGFRSARKMKDVVPQNDFRRPATIYQFPKRPERPKHDQRPPSGGIRQSPPPRDPAKSSASSPI